MTDALGADPGEGWHDPARMSQLRKSSLTASHSPAGAIPLHDEPFYVDSDDDLDLVFAFAKTDTGLPCGVSDVALTGQTYTGRSIVGYGTVRVVGCGP